MTARELIKELLDCNSDAKVSVVVHCKKYNFSLTFGGGEGIEKENCLDVHLYVDELCTNETSH